MSKITLGYRSSLKQIRLEDYQNPSQLAKLLQLIFKINEQIIGITDPFGKFYDLSYAAKHLHTLNNHQFNIITSQDAVNNLSFAHRQTELKEQQNKNKNKCQGIIQNIQVFRNIMPSGLVIILTLAESDQKQKCIQLEDLPFNYFKVKGNKNWFQLWNDQLLMIQCQIYQNWKEFYGGVAIYIKKIQSESRYHNEAKPPSPEQNIDESTKQGMLVEAYDELYRDGVLSQLEFYKKKTIIYQKPYILINRFFTGETIDRSQLFQRVREEVVKQRAQLSKLGKNRDKNLQHNRREIPIIVRKSSNLIQKVTSEQTISGEQERLLNLLQQLELKGLITQNQLDIYQKQILGQNQKVLNLGNDYFEAKIDQMQIVRNLKRLFRQRQQDKKLIQ